MTRGLPPTTAQCIRRTVNWWAGPSPRRLHAAAATYASLVPGVKQASPYLLGGVSRTTCSPFARTALRVTGFHARSMTVAASANVPAAPAHSRADLKSAASSNHTSAQARTWWPTDSTSLRKAHLKRDYARVCDVGFYSLFLVWQLPCDVRFLRSAEYRYV